MAGRIPQTRRKNSPDGHPVVPRAHAPDAKAIAERIKDIDVVIEVLDARLPGSSANPLLAELTGHKPSAEDPQQAGHGRCRRARSNGWPTTTPSPARAPSRCRRAMPRRRSALVAACHALAPGRGGMAKPMRVLICGVPNVGKSTLDQRADQQARTPRPATKPASPSWSSASRWPTTSTCTTRPACCGRASSSPRAATTWPPAAPSAATRTTRKKWRWSCWTTCAAHYAALLEARFKLERRGRDERRGSARSRRPPARRAAGQGHGSTRRRPPRS